MTTTSKQLTLTAKLIDQVSAPARAIVGVVAGIGSAAGKVAGLVTAPIRGVIAALTSVQGLVTGLAAFLVGREVVGSFNEAAEALDRIGHASVRLGLSVETLSGLKYAAEQNGSSWEEVASGVATAEKNLRQFAVTGKGRAAEAIKLLQGSGVELTGPGGTLRDMAELLPEIGRALNGLPGDQRGFIAQKIFGDAGPAVLQLDLERLTERMAEAKRLGAVFTPEQVASAVAYKEAVNRVSAAWLGLRAVVVEQVAPAIADVLDAAASGIAAAPKVIGNVVKLVRDALSGDLSDQVRASIGDVVSTAGRLVSQGAEGIAKLAVTSAIDVLGTAVPELVGYLGNLLVSEIRRDAPGIQAAVGAALIGAGFRETGTKMMNEALEGAREAAKEAQLAKPDVEGMTFDFSKTVSAWAKFSSEARENSKSLWGQVDALLGVSDALRDTRVEGEGVDEIMQRMEESLHRAGAAAHESSDFISGFKGQLVTANTAAERLDETGRQVADTLTSGAAGSFAGATIDAATGAKKLGQAWRDAGADIAKSIAEITLKMLYLRAITGAIGTFGGPGLPSDAAVAASDAGAWANSGGLIGRGGVQRFAGGGSVRDSVPAMLTPGEFVVRAPMVRRYGLGGLAGMNAGSVDAGPTFGGRGGGGGGVSIGEVHVHVSGGGQDGQRQGRLAAAALVQELARALDSSPAGRDALRRALA
jgi:hypothetical protein